jgi:lipoic acid synthetase
MSVEAPQQGARPAGYAPQGKDNGVVKSKGTVNVPLLEGQQPLEHRARKPEWLKVRAPGSPNYLRLKQLMRDQGLHTVCEEAHCPNIGECWESGTATFMILGDVCTRACKYCAVAHGLPTELDQDEPRRVADSVVTMGLEHAVVTSVNRDELKNGGAEIYAEVIRQIHARQPGCSVEVLVPDFKGNETALRIVVEAGPRSWRTTSTRWSGCRSTSPGRALLALHLHAGRRQADEPAAAHQERHHPGDG